MRDALERSVMTHARTYVRAARAGRRHRPLAVATGDAPPPPRALLVLTSRGAGQWVGRGAWLEGLPYMGVLQPVE